MHRDKSGEVVSVEQEACHTTINHAQFCRIISIKAFIFAIRTEVNGSGGRYENMELVK